MRIKKSRALSLVLSLAMVVSSFASMGLTANAASEKSGTATLATELKDGSTYIITTSDYTKAMGFTGSGSSLSPVDVSYNEDGSYFTTTADGGLESCLWQCGDYSGVKRLSPAGSSSYLSISSTKLSVTTGTTSDTTMSIFAPNGIKSDAGSKIFFSSYSAVFTSSSSCNVKVFEVSMCDHANQSTSHQDATCTTPGYTVVTCDDCGSEVSRTAIDSEPALGHDITGFTDNGDGTHTFTCSRGDSGIEACSYNDGVVTKEAGCTTSGEKTLTCTVCGSSKTEEIAALGHDYQNGVCTRCGAEEPEEVTIGDGTSSGYYVPYYNYYKNSTAEMLYTADEIGHGAGSIGSLAFKVASAASLEGQVQIFLANTTATALSGKSPADPEDTTKVFDGSLTLGQNTGWEKVEFDTPFAYDGSSNLLVVVTRKSSSYLSSLKYYYTNSISNNMAQYRGSDTADSYAVFSEGLSYTTSSNLPNVQFAFLKGEAAHIHSYTAEVTKPATCVDKGLMTYTCECGDSYTESIPAAGHNYENGICTVCGAADPDYVSESSWYNSSSSTVTIRNASEMAELAAIVNGTSDVYSKDSMEGKTVTLAADIDLSGYADWTPVGTSSAPFAGVFDGNGKSITGLTITDITGGNHGLFGYVTGTVKNFSVSGTIGSADAYLTAGSDNIGGAVGYNDGTVSGVTGNVSIFVKTTSIYAIGGIVGQNGPAGTIENCLNTADIYGSKCVGGICGRSYHNISACHNTGNISGNSGSGKDGIGGILGMSGDKNMTYTTLVTGCKNEGSVSNNNAKWFGGIVGMTDGTATVTYNLNLGTIVKGANTYNPIIGQNEGSSHDNYTIEGLTYSGTKEGEIGISKTAAELKSAEMITLLGETFKSGCGQYPVLSWEEAAAHTFGEAVHHDATCGADAFTSAVCTTCGQDIVTAVENGTATGNHAYDAGTVKKAAGCITAGEMLYTCTVCGAEKTEAIPATGIHSYGEGVVTTPATCGTDGVMTYTCECGNSYTEAIPATGKHSYVNGICTVCGADITSSLAATVTLSASSVDVTSEAKTVTLTVASNQALSVSGFQFTLVLPEGVTIADNGVTAVSGQGTVTAGGNTVIWYNSGNVSVADTLCTVVLNVPSTVITGEYPVGIKNVSIAAYNASNTAETVLSQNDEKTVMLAVTGASAVKTIDLTVTNLTGTESSAAVAAPADGWTEGENAFTVTCANACAAAVKHADGTYTRLTAAATQAADTYTFTADITEGDSLVVIKKGDVNGDGSIDLKDARLVTMSTLGSSLDSQQSLAADLDGDGSIKTNEARKIILAYLGTALGW